MIGIEFEFIGIFDEFKLDLLTVGIIYIHEIYFESNMTFLWNE